MIGIIKRIICFFLKHKFSRIPAGGDKVFLICKRCDKTIEKHLDIDMYCDNGSCDL